MANPPDGKGLLFVGGKLREYLHNHQLVLLDEKIVLVAFLRGQANPAWRRHKNQNHIGTIVIQVT